MQPRLSLCNYSPEVLERYKLPGGSRDGLQHTRKAELPREVTELQVNNSH